MRTARSYFVIFFTNSKMNDNRVWIESDDIFYLQDIRTEHKKLQNWVYTLEQDALGNKFLKKIGEKFDFDYKIYGLESKLIDRVVKTYKSTSGNLGVLLNGLKGTGKTVSSKMICNKLNQPTIIVDSNLPGGHIYLNDIPQDITIFIDEYEKIFENDSDMLTIMDGALNSDHRRVFLLTTNKLYVNENLIQRPSRIRYLKTFKDLTPQMIEEILQDSLVHKEFMKEMIEFIATLEVITVDVVKAICNEVNIHKESPKEFADIFNVKRITGKHDVYFVSEDGKKEMIISKNVKVSPRKEFDPDETVGCNFYIDNNYIGEITEVLDQETIKVNGRIDENSNFGQLLASKVAKPATPTNTLEETLEPIADGKKKTRKKQVKEQYGEIVFRVENALMTHRSYNWSREYAF